MTCKFNVGDKVRVPSWNDLVSELGLKQNGYELDIPECYSETLLERILEKTFYVVGIEDLTARNRGYALKISFERGGGVDYVVSEKVFKPFEPVRLDPDRPIKVGDTVRILTEVEFRSKFGEYWRDEVKGSFPHEMDHFLNRTFVVTEMRENYTGAFQNYKGLTEDYTITSDMITHVHVTLPTSEDKQIKVNEVILKLEKLANLQDQDLMMEKSEFTKLVIQQWINELKGA